MKSFEATLLTFEIKDIDNTLESWPKELKVSAIQTIRENWSASQVWRMVGTKKIKTLKDLDISIVPLSLENKTAIEIPIGHTCLLENCTFMGNNWQRNKENHLNHTFKYFKLNLDFFEKS